MYILFLKEVSNLSYYTKTFLVDANWFGVPFPKLPTFSRIFWVLLIDYSLYQKNDGRNFCLFVYFQSCSYLQTSQFCVKCYYRFLILISLYTLKKIPWKNYVRFWKWSLKRTLQSAQNVKYDFIHQRLGFNEDQIGMFK